MTADPLSSNGETSGTTDLNSQHHPEKWKTPYYAVIFTATRASPKNQDPTLPQDSPLQSSDNATPAKTSDDYGPVARRMFDLAKGQPGYLGVDSHKTVHGDGSTSSVTVSYWTDLESIKAWRAVAEHAEARRRGKTEWYQRWNVKVAKVEREYGGTLHDGGEHVAGVDESD